jgi:hypothetical protein
MMPSGPQQKIAADIATDGFSMLLVFDPEGQEPDFGYTVGLHQTAGHPEVLMTGLPHAMLQRLLDLIGRAALSGTRFDAGCISTALTTSGLPCYFATIDPRHYKEYLGQAVDYYGDQSFPALQCVWCDRQGRFPWQAGYEEQYRAMQPLLFDPTPLRTV